MTAGTTKTLKELLPSELQGERNTSNKKNRNSPLSKEQSPSSIQTRKTGRKQYESPSAEEKKGRYYIETRTGEAVDLIKGRILSRPAGRQNQLTTQGNQRYQVNKFSPPPEDEYGSPLTSRLSQLLSTPSDGDNGNSQKALVLGESNLLEQWSPASAMRLAREKLRDSDIVPSTKGRKTKSAKRSLKMIEK